MAAIYLDRLLPVGSAAGISDQKHMQEATYQLLIPGPGKG